MPKLLPEGARARGHYVDGQGYAALSEASCARRARNAVVWFFGTNDRSEPDRRLAIRGETT